MEREWTVGQKQTIVLQLARYRFHWRVTSPLKLPPYASSTLRGVFGRSLRKLLCITGFDECRGCALLPRCPYPPLFEPQNALPHSEEQRGRLPALTSYAIETSFAEVGRYRPGDLYVFDMVLMTPEAIKQLATIVAAWKRAFFRGVGQGDGKAELVRVEHLVSSGPAITLYSSKDPQVQRHRPDMSPPSFSFPEDVQLHLQTPLRIEHQGRLIRERNMTPSLFLRHLIRRVSFHICVQQEDLLSLTEIHQLNTLADQVCEGERNLVWVDWARYSSRQKRKMMLGGLTGRWQLLRVPPPLLPFLYLGQWLHVGKESVFGLGKYQWQSPYYPS